MASSAGYGPAREITLAQATTSISMLTEKIDLTYRVSCVIPYTKYTYLLRITSMLLILRRYEVKFPHFPFSLVHA